MDLERGELGCRPAAVVVDDGQRGRAVPAGDPLRGGRHAEQERAVADQADDRPAGCRELGADGRAPRPAQRGAAMVHHGPGTVRPQVLGDYLAVRHDLGQDQRVLVFEQAADARGEVLRGDHAVAAGMLAPGSFGLFMLVGTGRRHSPGPDHGRVGEVMVPNEPGDLLHRHPRAGGGEAPGRHVPHAHLGLQRVDVDAVDGGPGGRPVHRGNPRHVAVDSQDHVGLRPGPGSAPRCGTGSRRAAHGRPGKLTW